MATVTASVKQANAAAQNQRYAERLAWKEAHPNTFTTLENTLDDVARKQYTSPYESQIADILGQAQNYGSYESPYAERLARLTDELENSRFSYAPETDPAYAAMRKTYLNEAARTASDVLGKASAATGGRASSYAVNAASQAANYYKSQLAGKQAELFDAAYDRYLQEYTRRLGLLQELEGQDQTQYGRWGDSYTRLLQSLSALQSEDSNQYSRFLNTQNALTNSIQQNYQNLVNLITSTGYVPYDYELQAAGMNRATANRWKQYYENSIAAAGGGGGRSGGSGGYGGGYSYSSGGAGTQNSGGSNYADTLLDMGITPSSYSSVISNNNTPPQEKEKKKAPVLKSNNGGGTNLMATK